MITTGRSGTWQSTRLIQRFAHGISHCVGSVEEGKLADLCLWNPAFFGVKPDIVVKRRLYCLGTNGRCEREYFYAGASAYATYVWQLREGDQQHRLHLCLASRDGLRHWPIR